MSNLSTLYKVQETGPSIQSTAIDRYLNNSYVGQFPGPYTRLYDWKKTTGERIPNYFSLVKKGALIPMTSFYQSEIHGTVIPAVCSITQNGIPTTLTEWRAHDGGSVPCPESNWLVTSVELTAKHNNFLGDAEYYVQAAAAKIYSSGFDALTFLAELHQTRNMVRNLFVKVTNLLNEETRRRATKYLPDPGSYYLQYRYGWKQIWYDMNSIMDAWRNWDYQRTRRKERAGQLVRESAVTTFSDNSDGNRTITRNDTISWEIGLRGNVAADVQIPRLLFNPLTTTWEVLRLSFVVDWLINVGQALEALTFLALESEYTSAKGVYVKATRHTDYTLGAFKSGWAGTYTRGGGDSTGYMCSRTPVPVSTIPQLKLRLDGWKVLDLASLLAQALLRWSK